MTDLTLEQAIAEVQRASNLYRALKNIEGVLTAVQTSQNLKVELDAQIADASKRRDAANADALSVELAAKQRKDEIAAEVSAAISDAAARIASAKQDSDAQIDRLQTSVRALTDAVATAQAEHDRVVSDLRAKRDALADEVATLSAQLSSLKARIAGA